VPFGDVDIERDDQNGVRIWQHGHVVMT
jgi:hypothetical protein